MHAMGTWMTNKHLKNCIAPHAQSGGVLAGKAPAQQATLLKEYLMGIRGLWPDAYENFKDHMLWRAMGVETMMSLFAAAKHRCDLNWGREYTEETFTAALRPLEGCSIALPGGGEVPLDWTRGPLGSLSNKVGKALIRKQLLDKLNQADE